MPDEKSLFQTTGANWSERAPLGGIRAVLSPSAGSERRNLFLHGVSSFGARRALKYFPRGGKVVDFGCGTGRFTRFFATRQRRMLATEITPEMIEQAKLEDRESQSEYVLTDGVALPSASESLDGIWCCGVLRYSLFVPNPVYGEIAKEMFRVLRPGAYVVNLEMYVDVPPEVFLPGFEEAGFQTLGIAVLQRYSRLERMLSYRMIPDGAIPYSGAVTAFIRSRFDSPRRAVGGLRDYFFVWQKPGRRAIDAVERRVS